MIKLSAWIPIKTQIHNIEDAERVFPANMPQNESN